eukprot:9477836-Pyramimonas_sp.AAC.1
MLWAHSSTILGSRRESPVLGPTLGARACPKWCKTKRAGRAAGPPPSRCGRPRRPPGGRGEGGGRVI